MSSTAGQLQGAVPGMMIPGMLVPGLGPLPAGAVNAVSAATVTLKVTSAPTVSGG